MPPYLEAYRAARTASQQLADASAGPPPTGTKVKQEGRAETVLDASPEEVVVVAEEEEVKDTEDGEAGMKKSKTKNKSTPTKSTPKKTKTVKTPAQKTPSKPVIDIGKQKGQYDTRAVRTQVHKWQATAAVAAAEEIANSSADSTDGGLAAREASTERKAKFVRPTGDLVKELQQSTAPKKRVVSDEHWKKDRSPSSPRETPKIVKATALGFQTTVYLAADGKFPEGFVRKKIVLPAKKSSPWGSPKDLNVKKYRDGSAPAKLERDLEFNVELRRPSAKQRSSDVEPRLRTVIEHDENVVRPRSEPEKASNPMVQESLLKNAHIRKVRKVPETKRRKSEDEGKATPISNPHVSRMHAWLSSMPDPFVEDLEDVNETSDRPRSLGDLGSMLGPRTTQVRDRREKDYRNRRKSKSEHGNNSNFSHTDDGSCTGSPTPSLKRSGARRSAHSPRIASKSTFESHDASQALQLAPVPGDLVRVSKSGKSRPGITRNIASHADLLSVLSLPADESKGLVPARNMRTTRSRLGKGTTDDVFEEIRSDDAKYSRDLRTMVDGVIPVLLNGTMGSTGRLVTSAAKDNIVELGIALERLQSSHRRIPMNDVRSFLGWAQRTYQVYADYIRAWRMDFKGMVINLAPRDSPPGDKGETSKGDGERVDVTFLLKRPLVRLRYLSKTLKSLDLLEPSNEAAVWAAKYQGLVDDAKVKQDVERARLEDEAAAAVDNTRVRDPENLAPIPGPTVRPNRCVRARDIFDLHLNHTSGQKLDCRVMLFLRDDSTGDLKGGDVLICQIEDSTKWLLFPPVELNRLSARRGRSDKEIVVLMRSHTSLLAEEWRELLTFTSESKHAAADWLKMLGSSPMPPQSVSSRTFNEPVDIKRPPVNSRVAQWISGVQGIGDPDDISEIDVPIGEQSVLSFRSEERKLRSSSRQVSFEDYVSPAVAGYAEKARTNFKNLFSDLASSRIISSGGIDRSGPTNLRRTPPARPPIRRQLSPILSESTSTHPKTRTSYEKPARCDTAEVLTPALEPSTPTPVTPMSRSRYHGRTQSASASTQDLQNLPGSTGLRNVSTPQLSPATPTSNRHRRSSSPLKHEYVLPDSPSDTSSPPSDDGFDDAGSVTSESSVDDLVPELYPDFKKSRDTGIRTLPSSTYSPKGTTTVAPSQSVSQVQYDSNSTSTPVAVNRTLASIFSWSDKGFWAPLHADLCSVVVSPGLIEAFRMTEAHSTPVLTEAALHDLREIELPLVALELTPLVPLRQGTAIDISIRSPPTANSQIKTGNNIMFRSGTGGECDILYQMINQARINNPRYLALQNARGPIGGSGWASYMDKQASTRSASGWWKLGSKKSSYRASTKRNTASIAETRSSVASMSSAISALKRFSSGSNMFNVARSTITSRVGGNSQSRTSTTFTNSSSSSTPVMLDSSKGTPAGMTDLKIRMYERETSSKWRDMGSARLTIMHPPRPTAEIITPTGHLKQEKRIIVTGKTKGETLLDVTLGETSFERVARTGIAVKVWEQHEEVGKTGGVLTAVVRVFMIQMKSEAEAAYAFSLVGRQRY